MMVKRKVIPITGLWGPEGSGRLRLQITRHSVHEGGKVVTGRLYPQEYPEAESTPGHTEMSAATEYNPSVSAWNRSRVLQTCSVVS